MQTPRHSGSLFTSYRLPFGLEIGYGFTYQGSFATHQRSLLQRTQYFADDYLVHRAFLSYPFGNGMTAQLNVQNITNERSEEHTSELQSLMRISYAVFCLKNTKNH